MDRRFILCLFERLQLVTQQRSLLEAQRFRRREHAPPQVALDLAPLTAQEPLGASDQLSVLCFGDLADARRRAASDLVIQTGAAAVHELGIRAGSQWKHAVQNSSSTPGVACARPWTKGGVSIVRWAADQLDVRERIILA